MDIVERLRKHVNDRGGASLENGAWSMMLKGADEIERLQKENELLQKELKKHLSYQDHRHGRIGTHDPICCEYGPRHYECALREIERLRGALEDIAKEQFAKNAIIAADLFQRIARAALKEVK